MKLLQLNIWMGRLLPQVIKLIQSESPDILCLQEVLSTDKEVKLPDVMFNSLQHILKDCGYSYYLLAPIHSIAISDTKAEFGNAVISRYPLSDQQVIFTNGQYNANHTAETHIVNSRNLQMMKVEYAEGKSLTLINHHAYWEKNPLGSETSVEKMQIVAGLVKKQTGPLILSGDLNVTSDSPAMRVFDGVLEDLTATHKVPSTLSVLGKAANVACDHILINPDIRVSSFSVKEDLVSDHKALVLEFSI